MIAFEAIAEGDFEGVAEGDTDGTDDKNAAGDIAWGEVVGDAVDIVAADSAGVAEGDTEGTDDKEAAGGVAAWVGDDKARALNEEGCTGVAEGELHGAAEGIDLAAKDSRVTRGQAKGTWSPARRALKRKMIALYAFSNTLRWRAICNPAWSSSSRNHSGNSCVKICSGNSLAIIASNNASKTLFLFSFFAFRRWSISALQSG